MWPPLSLSDDRSQLIRLFAFAEETENRRSRRGGNRRLSVDRNFPHELDEGNSFPGIEERRRTFGHVRELLAIFLPDVSHQDVVMNRIWKLVQLGQKGILTDQVDNRGQCQGLRLLAFLKLSMQRVDVAVHAAKDNMVCGDQRARDHGSVGGKRPPNIAVVSVQTIK
jgi:hypothetical protein